MKKFAKKFLILVVVICFVVGANAFAGVMMPFWLSNGNGLVVPNSGLNALFGGLNPLGGVQQQNLTVFVSNNGVLPQNPTRTAPTSFRFKNTSAAEVWVTSLSGGVNPAQVLLAPGGQSQLFKVTTAGNYEFEISNPTGGNNFIWKIKVTDPTVASGGAGNTVSGGGNTVPAGVLNQNVTIKTGSVDPLSVNIPTTGKVTWKNGTTVSRKIVDPNGVFSSPVIAAGTTFQSPAFNTAGVFKYTVVSATNPNDVFAGSINVIALPAGAGVGAGSTTVAGGSGTPNVVPGPGGSTPHPLMTAWITTDHKIFPNPINIPAGVSVQWINMSKVDRKLESVAPGVLSSVVIPKAGGSWTSPIFTASTTIKYQAKDASGNNIQLLPIDGVLNIQ